jgi:hypothetical protein
MSRYLLTFRAPKNWAPTADRASARSAWQQKLAANLKDRGNPVFKADTLGNCGADTVLGGYSLIRAGNLEAAVVLAKWCPGLQEGFGVELGEVTNLDDQFDKWLEEHPIP